MTTALLLKILDFLALLTAALITATVSAVASTALVAKNAVPTRTSIPTSAMMMRMQMRRFVIA